MKDMKWYKIAKKIVDILAYVLAAIGGFSMLESCTMPRDNSVGEVKVVVVKESALELLPNEKPAPLPECIELDPIEITDISDYPREDIR